ncbi:hypothetical protein PghCCS26_14450 [Paenibacillus glycanilyticus]|uniref:SLH domain-containing protein n=1 Tax=Paenibacillus glycanilyticus TaxID=126569 RepID=A0ABQ6NJF5_9BACL|nr:S-layer homology domain-containing protein [Paenibacillus glycanilyticus]GMK44317.1 hypothetical protein PghCCS26_14450 [Paenibacillus glycanilyticus]
MKTLITRLTPLVIAASLLSPVSTLHAASSSQQFNDLADLAPEMKAKLDALIAADIFNGTSTDTFGLDQTMTRAQLAVVLARAMNLNTSMVANTSFTDIPATSYASSYVEAVKEAGLMNGIGNDVFNPNGNVTKEQLAAVLVRSLGEQSSIGDKVNGTVSD